MNVGSLVFDRNFKNIPNLKIDSDLSSYDYILTDGKVELSKYKNIKKVFIGKASSSITRESLQYKAFFNPNITEEILLKKLSLLISKEDKAPLRKKADPEEEVFLLEKKIENLSDKLARDKEGSIEIKGLREYVVRLLGVNTLEQLVYETESLRILRYKGIKVSLIYTDNEGGFLCTKNTLRKIDNIDFIKQVDSGEDQSFIKKDLANILSRPVLKNFKLYSEKIDENESFHSLFESQTDFDETDYFLGMLKKLLFTNFVRVIQSEKLFKISSLLSQAFSQIQGASILIGPDYEIKVSNRDGSVGRKCFEYMFNSNKPCLNCPMDQTKSTSQKNFQKSYKLEEHSYIVHSSSVKELNHNFFLHIYETQDESLKRESIEIQRGKLQSLGLVTRALTHELNNPLTGIRELTKDMACDHLDQTKEDLEEINKASIRCLKIIENLKKFSSQKIEFERINLKDVINDALVLTKILTHNTKVRVDLTDQIWVSGSETLLSQMIFNIIKNSVEAMEGRGEIDITLAKKDSKAVMVFSDSGPGFPEQIKDISLFGTKNKIEGTGFGLFLINEFVKLHKGELKFGNQSDSGAYFEISFPIQ